MKIAVDAMGGDYAPEEVVLGAIEAAETYNLDVALVGDEKRIQKGRDPYRPLPEKTARGTKRESLSGPASNASSLVT